MLSRSLHSVTHCHVHCVSAIGSSCKIEFIMVNMDQSLVSTCQESGSHKCQEYRSLGPISIIGKPNADDLKITYEFEEAYIVKGYIPLMSQINNV